MVEAFLTATENGDIAKLVELLDPNVTFRSDGGGLVPAARKVFTGAERVARLLTAGARRFHEQLRMSPLLVNGELGLLLETRSSSGVLSFTLDEGRITEINAIVNPQKLRMLPDASIGPERPVPDEPSRRNPDPRGYRRSDVDDSNPGTTRSR